VYRRMAMLARKIKGLFRLIRFELPFSAGVCEITQRQ